MGSGTVPILTVDDAEAILTEVPSVKYVAPDLSGVAQVVHGNQNWSTSIIGTIPEMLEIRCHVGTLVQREIMFDMG